MIVLVHRSDICVRCMGGSSSRGRGLVSLLVCLVVQLGFPHRSAGKESACSAGDPGSIAGLGRSPGEGKGYPLQYSGLENSVDCVVHGVAIFAKLSYSFFPIK